PVSFAEALVTAVLDHTVIAGIMASFAKGHCLCIGPGLSGVNPKHIGKLEIYRPGINCDHIEVIVTLKHSGKKRCLSNKSKQRLIIIEEAVSGPVQNVC
uniref:Chemokine interleukin-8-like domain-containing protein n=1 Tax=Dromaius novaehollandiae TaxID=8790 RepID=A0A8C4JNW4_DRONO